MIERLEQFFTANDVNTAEKKVATLLTVVGANTYALIKDLVASNKPAATKTFDEFVKILEDHLNPKPLVIFFFLSFFFFFNFRAVQISPTEPERR